MSIKSNLSTRNNGWHLYMCGGVVRNKDLRKDDDSGEMIGNKGEREATQCVTEEHFLLWWNLLYKVQSNCKLRCELNLLSLKLHENVECIVLSYLYVFSCKFTFLSYVLVINIYSNNEIANLLSRFFFLLLFLFHSCFGGICFLSQ